MTATNGWPGKPGVPPQDGVYWLKHNVVGDKQPCLYEKGKWYCCGSDIGLSPMQAAAGYSYLGPVLTPDEAARLQARVAKLEGALKDAAASVKEWGAYASQYLQDKWDLPGEVARYIAIAEGKNDAAMTGGKDG